MSQIETVKCEPQPFEDRPTILIADDDPVMRLKLRRVIEHNIGALVLEARDGEEAWHLYRQHSVRMIISDWMMPGLDGPSLCRRVREEGGKFYTYFILVTGRQEAGDLVRGMDSGADDYVRKPFDVAELKSRINAGFRVVDLEYKLAAQNIELANANAELEQAIEQAGLVQRGMLPSVDQLRLARAESGVNVAFRYEACQNLGGDLLGLVRLPGGEFGAFIADVSGHGIAASLSAVSLYTFLKTSITADARPLQVISRANRFCLANMPEHVYATMIYLHCSPQSAQVSLVVAGHPALIRLDAGGQVTEYCSTYPPLGLFDDEPAESDLQYLKLDPGERLIAYTDGVIETCNDEGKQFSEELLARAVREAATGDLELLTRRIMERIHIWHGSGRQFSDDVSIMALELAATVEAAHQSG